ncbi:ferritin-like domain-containing protein [Sphingobacterium prati]|uniref:YciE/YciF ferroxidase family protein n=1 Tax=Sphingobacterium prati TaxID=2737006 RepID=UPI001556FF1F|nr:ferritin-like domain-containing protein [Sphingobacterium prati]NPE46851.1 ferritin-like domain-containing protein [Sphingobacterium prati]
MKHESGTTPKFKTKTPLNAESSLQELFLDGIMDLYWAENHLVKSLPKMIKAANSSALITAIENHLKETEQHVVRLEQIFKLMGKEALAKKCDAMEGLTKEAEGIIAGTEAGTVARDVGIILASQKVEHYEIASYSGLLQLAFTLGLQEVASLLEQTLGEEEAADALLYEVAENQIEYTAPEQ